MNFYRGIDGILNGIVLLLSILTGVIVFFIFNLGATVSERLSYALIVGFSTWMMLFIFQWTLIWLVRGLRK